MLARWSHVIQSLKLYVLPCATTTSKVSLRVWLSLNDCPIKISIQHFLRLFLPFVSSFVRYSFSSKSPLPYSTTFCILFTVICNDFINATESWKLLLHFLSLSLSHFPYNLTTANYCRIYYTKLAMQIKQNHPRQSFNFVPPTMIYVSGLSLSFWLAE